MNKLKTKYKYKESEIFNVSFFGDYIMKYFIYVFLIFIFSCGSDGGAKKDEQPEPNYDFTGTWSGTLTGASETTTFIFYATQSGSVISGTLSNDAGFIFSVDGRAWADNIYLKLTDTNELNTGYVVTCNGECDGSYASGTWYDTANQSGDWEAWIQ